MYFRKFIPILRHQLPEIIVIVLVLQVLLNKVNNRFQLVIIGIVTEKRANFYNVIFLLHLILSVIDDDTISGIGFDSLYILQ